MASRINPVLLGRLNERRVLELLQHGPLSRADITRRTGISAPTASKIVDSLVRTGLLEEGESPKGRFGRPGRTVRLASQGSRVIGVSLDRTDCRLVWAGLDGVFHHEEVFPTPGSYRGLLESVVRRASPLLRKKKIRTLGMGVSMPGLINRRTGEGVLSPNLHITDGRSPARDLAARLDLECVLRQESHALVLAERSYGGARELDDFAMLDIHTGLGLGVWSGGRLLEGTSGLAGELGHVVLDPDGELCGCGNRGCLETVSTDRALARSISARAGAPLEIGEIIRRARDGRMRLDGDLRRTSDGLATAIGAVINIFNPSTLFVHGRLFEVRDGVFEDVLERVKGRVLGPSAADCRIERARGTKVQGAVAAILYHLFDLIAPTLPGRHAADA